MEAVAGGVPLKIFLKNLENFELKHFYQSIFPVKL